jgi:hypothetical protein
METLTVQENQIQATTPDQLLTLAVDKNLDIDKLEKLLAMKERWDKEQARKDFFSALSDFQIECPELRKTKKVSFNTKSGGLTEYNYAPLADIDRQIKKVMKDKGLSKRWEITDVNGKTKVTCLITHVNGHTERTEMESASDESGGKNAIQAKGSAIEYMKRYTLIGALGLTTADTDIDGRMPELDIDKLHKQYMELYEKIVAKDEKFRTPGDPDNWNTDRTPQLYVQAIGKARQMLAKLTV